MITSSGSTRPACRVRALTGACLATGAGLLSTACFAQAQSGLVRPVPVNPVVAPAPADGASAPGASANEREYTFTPSSQVQNGNTAVRSVTGAVGVNTDRRSAIDSTLNGNAALVRTPAPPAAAPAPVAATPLPGLLACPASIAVWNDPSAVIPLANANPSTALPNGNPWCLYSGMHAGDSWMGAWDRVAGVGIGFYPTYTDTGSGYSVNYAVDYGSPTMSRLGTKCSNQFGKSGDWQAWMFSNCGSPVPRSVWRFRSDSVFYGTYGASVMLDSLPVAVVYLANNPFFQDAYVPVACGVTVGGTGVWANQSTRANYLPMVSNPTFTYRFGC